MAPTASPRVEAPRRQTSDRRRSEGRTRASNACNRCRQHKIKCSGSLPCTHCSRRNVPCAFDERSRKILITRGWLSDLESQVAVQKASARPLAPRVDDAASETRDYSSPMLQNALESPTSASDVGIVQEIDVGAEDLDADENEVQNVTNPLVLDSSAYYSPESSNQTYWLGVSSNWSFGIRVLKLAHEKVFGDAPFPHSILHYEGSTYDIGWSGRRALHDQSPKPVLPPADFAVHLINTVKFHCNQLFHLFDENSFMLRFNQLQSGVHGPVTQDDIWLLHYMLVLALGKALKFQSNKNRPAGADLFRHAMETLPTMMYLISRPLESAEVLCCIALYLQCIDMRISAYNYIGQAVRIAISNGWHLAGPSDYISEGDLERCRKVWWTIYTLDCRISALQGAPATINSSDIHTQLPAFKDDKPSLLALKMHVELSRIMASVQQTVYIKHDKSRNDFVKSIQKAIKSIAGLNDARGAHFPLDVQDSASNVSRVAAHIHLFHHQAIVFCTKPLLFFFFKKTLELPKPIRISSSGGLRALIKTSIGSARQIMKILAALEMQDLLEIFIPFDLEALWSGALVLLIARIVDPTVYESQDSCLRTAHSILETMSTRGNRIAACRKSELEHLDMTLQQLTVTNQGLNALESVSSAVNDPQVSWGELTQADFTGSDTAALQDFDFDDVLNGQQLEAVANALDICGMEWLTNI